MYGLTSIIILTWNQLSYTRQCIASIRMYTTRPYELVMVDNGSVDGTRRFLASLDGARVILNPRNYGFARGCNQGMKAARGDNLLFLNNDTVVTPNWLDNMLACLYSDKTIGLVAPCSNKVGSGNQVEAPYSNMKEMIEFAGKFNRPDHSRRKEHSGYWLSGFCVLGRRCVFNRVGYWDERFRHGSWEDVDYSKRVTAAGYKLYVAGDVFIHHYGSKSFKGNRLDLGRVQKKNALEFEKKWSPSAPAPYK